MNYSNILINYIEEGVYKVIMNRADNMNSLTSEMIKDLCRGLDNLERKEDCRVIILTGTGKAYSAGGDIKYLSAGLGTMEGKSYLQLINSLILKIFEMEKIIISAVNGFAVGGGCNLCFATDLIFASSKAVFAEAFLPVGLVPDAGGTFFLPRILGLPRAKELALTGRKITAEEAASMGLINRVVPPENLDPAVLEMAREISSRPSRQIGLVKVLMNRSLWLDLRSALEYEAYAQGLCMQTIEHQEGVRAFLEKRKPVFTK
ncbi:2-(1,2-epoxy-1,2-dihydrophenyl)acetyl-CoA isomerase [Desulfotomaculum arcticum]|uniref:2-(1,2-epoxy-1,2-dihydrophenyl)acetyl-CoA isomerase n=1 Tax=Desulfotruncus arcticus DSM 17038 TaxID=1121424 RepID=A0A1I2XLH3_9FIRM|nr:enoyl-CoA hydratase-related protein [Desulfotruncus arcticus]SFH14358.1 2-(1,2-epoxy-1,2-dihydrophenyl)acetyl-CoA isomerase [Desulfotomaculum arcticum] [Desulfotruncus arcticus DSM 17038]